MSESSIQNVSDTAFMVAAYRAAETERPNALFQDPLAARLSGDHGKKIIENLPKGAFVGGWSVIIRTCVIDRLIQTAIAEGIETILNLGAGLDTRPYRMDLPASLRWIEADFPHMIELKEEKLAGETACCRLERISVDLGDDAAREKFLAEVAASSAKILVLTEGVIPYLTPEQVTALARDLKSKPSFRYWIADYFAPETYRYRRRKGMTRVMKNAPFRFEPADFFGFFRERGWQPKEIRYLAEEAEQLNRPLRFPLPMRMWIKLVSLLMSPERRASMKRFMGYVLFEPMA
ncbi:methyltransferase [Chthoniobacter flavus Ellin428]|uniref:S-adenosyl-L-methionine-dependent methyltransferase n=1 Tax=Chthoniobacter flavus Ellin428 TaxID=497964 RepID=B4CYD9_9BACT|nr:SAM-dependent methyltransferase [Chthoniobacter flavus]EDY20480.1 methyltransferase [Chthoniobacter flavus Ellin428]TCO85577.1 methyltransferase (TIGR00027 family) [Chthoniobacter flavus]